ncbi:acyl-CoA N-acyltransferase [Hyaloraphidium curvatum]|nr:acyl-CoA N-acyltransferase [Hyaloraphidium curvatum]
MSGDKDAADGPSGAPEPAEEVDGVIDGGSQVPAGFPSRQRQPKPQAGPSAPAELSARDFDAKQAKQLEDLLKSLSTGAGPAGARNALALQQQLGLLGRADKNAAKGPEQHKFWGTQPVPQHADKVEADGPIEPDKAEGEIRKEPLPLPNEFEWCLVDVTVEEELKELYTLLTENYVEDDDAMFRFDYSAAFLKWGLQPPGWRKDWHVAVRVKEGKRKLVAFISAIPSVIRVRDHQQTMVEINFLCVHKKLRSKRLAPVLIKEITRRVHLTNCFQAVYTAGVLLPKPVSSCKYYHRSLNPKKLVETGFSHLGKNQTIPRLERLYKIPASPTIPGFRAMTEADAPEVQRLLSSYLVRYELAPVFSEEEVKHWFTPIKGVVESFVVEDPQKAGHLTDFVSYYSLPSSVINNEKHRRIEAAYLFYYASESVLAGGAPAPRLQELVRSGLIEAKNRNFDVFNCLDLMDNQTFLEELKFGKGDGTLHYYLYNFRARPVATGKMGLVLL